MKPMPRFAVGVNYWPRRRATGMWRRFDAGEIGDDFAHMASLGLDTVRFFLRWDDFQPEPDAVDATMLARLETLVSLAAQAHLVTLPTLACGHMDGTNFLPEWALDRTRRARAFPTVAGGAPSPFAAGDLYAGALLEAQRVLARAVGERLRGHPGVRAWDIGHAFADLSEPAPGKVPFGEHSSAPVSEAELAAWSSTLAKALRDASGGAVTAGTTASDVLRDRNVRLVSLCMPFAFASMQGSNVASPFARGRLDPEAIPFLAMLAASFSQKPVLVTGFGNPTCPPDRFSAFERFAGDGEPPNPTIAPTDSAFAPYPCLTEHENAAYCASVLERLHADGRLGALWWCWSDYPDDLANEPPFDRAPHARTYGILRGDGTEKPVAAALSAFARERRTIARADEMPMIAPVYYYRTLPTSTKTLYDAFLRFVEDRR